MWFYFCFIAGFLFSSFAFLFVCVCVLLLLLLLFLRKILTLNNTVHDLCVYGFSFVFVSSFVVVVFCCHDRSFRGVFTFNN